jgi:hypothetical protein
MFDIKHNKYIVTIILMLLLFVINLFNNADIELIRPVLNNNIFNIIIIFLISIYSNYNPKVSIIFVLIYISLINIINNKKTNELIEQVLQYKQIEHFTNIINKSKNNKI